MLQNIMHGDHIRTGKNAGGAKKIGDVDKIAIQTLDLGAALEITL
jgi:hypothetical protein